MSPTLRKVSRTSPSSCHMYHIPIRSQSSTYAGSRSLSVRVAHRVSVAGQSFVVGEVRSVGDDGSSLAFLANFSASRRNSSTSATKTGSPGCLLAPTPRHPVLRADPSRLPDCQYHRPLNQRRASVQLKLVGEYGLRNKREVWRVGLTLSKIRRAARQLLTLDEKDPKRLFEGNALIRRLVRVGVLDESRMKLDYVLALKIEDFLERRLQTCVYKLGLAKSIHHARVLIRQRHIRVGKQIVNVPSFIVRLDSQKHIDFSLKSPFGSGRAGRVKRKKAKAAEAAAEGEEEEEDE
ncbi:hypothetical protein L249_8232 [Ophiocordyceps polyrhachis-furcata BCC 54312]|uniref:Uncharacterized protein n=1 Tax=Ophiocordyceps polyrhachis-furcata BCC 54312 TaxID=1330021 RepID=A0A367LH92_9HYPO|nr:hypothetical protein L249_8232 [Ophiocordyceps polyrhachis-furcata BCC 54312]